MDESEDVNAVIVALKQLGALPDKVYEDAVRPWLQPLGQEAGVVVRAVIQSVHSCAAWIRNPDELPIQILSTISDKIKNILPIDRIRPRSTVGQSAIDGLVQSEDEPELFDQFANLLAHAMVRQHADNVHPSFPDILKQMSSSEAQLARWLFLNFQSENRSLFPCVQVTAPSADDKTKILLVLPIYLGEEPHKIFNNTDNLLSASLNNLNRLGLIGLPEFGPFQPVEDFLIEKDMRITNLLLSIKDTNLLGDGVVNKGYVTMTAFGILFFKTCLVPPR